MADSDSVIRRRITTLYSQTCENEKEVGESSSRDDCSCDTKAGIAGQIKDVAEVMFHDMCHDLGQEVITKGDIDGALQSLFTKSVNPTQSLFQTSSYAQSAEVTKSAINKLLLEAIRSSPAQQVRILCPMYNISWFVNPLPHWWGKDVCEQGCGIISGGDVPNECGALRVGGGGQECFIISGGDVTQKHQECDALEVGGGGGGGGIFLLHYCCIIVAVVDQYILVVCAGTCNLNIVLNINSFHME